MKDYNQLAIKLSQEKRAENRRLSPLLLTEKGFSFVSRNNGAHLIVEDKVDFWPGTGQWIVRQDGFAGRGVKNLIGYLNGKDQTTA